MHIIYDGIISQVQKTGGAAIMFDEIYARLERDGVEFNVFDYDRGLQRLKCSIPLRPRFLERYREFPNSKLPVTGKSVFHSTCYRIPEHHVIPVVTTVYDFTYERVIGGLKAKVHTWQKSKAIINSDHLICISNHTKNDLLEFHPKLNESKISVVYCGVSEAFFTKPNRTTEPYILYVGQRVAYKNFYSLVDAIQNLKDVTLLCVGGGSFSNSELEILNKKIPRRFKHAGYVSTDDLNNIYNSVLCFVYPSKYEGFGMPIIESMRAGCPVISVNNSSITEVSGGAAVLVGNGDRDEIQQAIIGMFDEEYRQNCINQGLKQSLKFSWEKMYLETVDVYKKLV